MKTLTFPKNFFFAASISLIILSYVTGCSDSEDKKAVATGEHNPFDHPHEFPVTDIQKHKFEHEFAKQCVQNELRNSINKDVDEERYAKPCMCIATYMMKDLTAQEAKKFITEHENPRSLQIKFDSAAYHCLQQKAQSIQEPHMFGKR
ncbi:MAG: hypothetical protein PHY16_05190 [Methylobacter sp.]|nr:hypothetical protein [Methylobacter sp.]